MLEKLHIPKFLPKTPGEKTLKLYPSHVATPKQDVTPYYTLLFKP
jgi:hypothetical protein